MDLQTLYIALGIVGGGGGMVGVVRALWRMGSAAQRLIAAIDQNTAITGRLARDMASLRRATRRRDRELSERLTALEEARRGQGKSAADPRPANRRARRPGPDRGRGVGPV